MKKNKFLAILLCLCVIMSTVIMSAGASDLDVEETPEPTAEVTADPLAEPAETTEAELFYDSLMATSTAEEYDALIDGKTGDELSAFDAAFTDEQKASLEAHYTAFFADTEAEPDAVEPDEPVESEIYVPTVNYTDVAPFLEPVTGVSSRSRMMMFSLMSEDPGTESEGLVTDKSATENDDGIYTISIDAFTTGTVTATSSTIPTDIVLVLDVSGSMRDSFSSYAFRTYTQKTNSAYYELRHNNNNNANLWYQLPDGSYASVSVVKETVVTGTTHSPIDTKSRNINYYNNGDNLYQLKNGVYYKVTVTRGYSNKTYTYTYTSEAGLYVYSERNNGTPDFGSAGPLYQESNVTTDNYTYTCTDADGSTITIGTSTGSDTFFTPTLYERYASGTTTKLAALKSAVTSFINSVATQAKGADGILGTEDDVDHRIAIVKFAGDSSDTVGNEQYWYTYNYSQIVNQLTDMSVSGNSTTLVNSVNSLIAGGATQINFGMAHANTIFESNPIPVGEQRSRVVVAFTDGSPTSFNGFETSVANAAIDNAYIAKDTHGATVYSVGIFAGADATSAGNYTGNITQQCNWFMQNLSSNNGTPQSPSYYLSASDAGALDSVFQQISSNISTPSVSLGATTTLKDIATGQFTIPANTTAITVKTFDCLSYDSSTGAATWSETGTVLSAAQTTIDAASNTITVSGFDFDHNFVSSTGRSEANPTQTGDFRGRKIQITFTVTPTADFLGGDDVYTNGADSGVYDGAGETVENFERPTVDIPVKRIIFGTVDQTIYLGETVNLASSLPNPVTYQLAENGPTYTVNGVNNAYVDIVYEATTLDGTLVGTYTIPAGETSGTWVWNTAYDADGVLPLTETTVYNVKCTVTSVNDSSNKAETSDSFTVTVKTCSLTIQKSGSDTGTGESFIFDVAGPNNISLTVSVEENGSTTIVGLPIGTYTVTEQSGWSWRYTAAGAGAATLGNTSQTDSATVTITNVKSNTKWLSGDDYVKNIASLSE